MGAGGQPKQSAWPLFHSFVLTLPLGRFVLYDDMIIIWQHDFMSLNPLLFINICRVFCVLSWFDMRIWWQWHGARIISSQKMYGLGSPKHHKVEVRRGVTDTGWRESIEQRKIGLLSLWMLEGWFLQFETLPIQRLTYFLTRVAHLKIFLY